VAVSRRSADHRCGHGRGIGLLSDSLESLVNLGAALMLLSMLRIAGRPADEGHAYGHSKAEYFASGLLEEIEQRIAQSFSSVTVDSHLEPVEDPSSYRDEQLDRTG
jgi:divalent metal cation (Fe/Co/Zn/Cd) transporter